MSATSLPLAEAEGIARAAGPWATALRRLRHDRAALAALLVLLLITLACAFAPVYAHDIAHAEPFLSNLDGQAIIGGHAVPVMQDSTEGLGLGMNPIGPTWNPRGFFLGADGQGRDLLVRLLYGGRSSLLISGGATVICLSLALLVGLAAGFFGGWVDAVLSRCLDVLWAFPVYLLAISLSIVLINQGLRLGPFEITSDSLLLPMLIIAAVGVPYVARPLRGEVLTLRRSEFVLASIGLGVPPWRILLRDILPHVAATLIVFAPLMMALNLLAESALSYLSIGVQPPAASWGTIIQDGQTLLYTRPLVSVAPGLAIVATVLALNVLGDGLRDALDIRAKLR